MKEKTHHVSYNNVGVEFANKKNMKIFFFSLHAKKELRNQGGSIKKNPIRIKNLEISALKH